MNIFLQCLENSLHLLACMLPNTSGLCSFHICSDDWSVFYPLSVSHWFYFGGLSDIALSFWLYRNWPDRHQARLWWRWVRGMHCDGFLFWSEFEEMCVSLCPSLSISVSNLSYTLFWGVCGCMHDLVDSNEFCTCLHLLRLQYVLERCYPCLQQWNVFLLTSCVIILKAEILLVSFWILKLLLPLFWVLGNEVVDCIRR